MDAAHSFVASLKSLLRRKSYTKVTIAELCKDAGFSRRTFYKHFADKDAVVVMMIREDWVNPVIEMRKILDLDNLKSANVLLTEQALKSVRDNREVYENLLKNMGKLKLLYTILNENYELSKQIYLTYDYPEDEMDYAAYAAASITATTVIRWIESGFDTPPTKLAKLYELWVFAHWRELRTQF